MRKVDVDGSALLCCGSPELGFALVPWVTGARELGKKYFLNAFLQNVSNVWNFEISFVEPESLEKKLKCYKL